MTETKGKDDKKQDSKDTTEQKEEKKNDKQEPKLSPQQQTIQLLRSHIQLITKGVSTRDVRLFTRVLRQLPALRRKLTGRVLRTLSEKYDAEGLQFIKEAESSAMSDTTDEDDLTPEGIAAALAKSTISSKPSATSTTDAKEDKSTTTAATTTPKSAAAPMDTTENSEAKQAEEAKAEKDAEPELRVYLRLLTLLYLLDHNHQQAAAQLSTQLFTELQPFNRRSLDAFSAKVFYYYALTHEQIGQGPQIRDSLLLAHRTACLQHNEPGQASLTTALLRNYLQSHLYTQADTFRLKSTFPEQRSSAHHARYLYYTGRIQAVQLHYSDAYNSLTQALRKAPQKGAVGFRQVITKLLVLVQLLMGDIPERSLFATKSLRRSLDPYLQLTQAVRLGDLQLFTQVMTNAKAVFEKDGNYSLIVRLRSNVIKAGLRKINLAYSRISIAEIAKKLNFDNAEDAEYMVVKAIADGVIEATVDREKGFLFSKEVSDVYSTGDPQSAFHKRIRFCLDIRNDAVKSLRFPPNAYKRDLDEEEAEFDDDAIIGDEKKKDKESS